MSEPRFVVREWSGCYVQVIDTANCRKPVREWNRSSVPPVERRQRARAEARRLNDWDATAEDDHNVPRFPFSLDGAA